MALAASEVEAAVDEVGPEDVDVRSAEDDRAPRGALGISP